MLSFATTDNLFFSNDEKVVWILGKKRNSETDRDEIIDDIRSRLWFTYRRGFTPIGDENGPTSDAGWGCMHRCGQMMIGQTIMRLHLNQDWRWDPERLDEVYRRILKMFEDRPSAIYSIHSIATQAASDDIDGKINKWLGPNTVAQVFKKLVTSDRWSNFVAHVTTEDGIVIQEIKNLCRPDEPPRRHKTSVGADDTPSECSDKGRKINESRALLVSNPISIERDDEIVEIIMPPVYNLPASLSDDDDGHPMMSEVPSSIGTTNAVSLPTASSSTWRPLLLILPLRLGLHELNMMYAPHLLNLFKLRQCVGILGGRPMHALWLIGFIGDDIICLDPHTTQPAAILSEWGSDSDHSGASSVDASFHCSNPNRLPINLLDPSLAVGFVCTTEVDFDSLCADLSERGIAPTLFEIHETRPSYLPPPSFSAIDAPEGWGELYSPGTSAASDSTANASRGVKTSLDGDFEIL
ncbi:hypothetical protein Aperf_G00000016172 [Anoplocephala perfoliata]